MVQDHLIQPNYKLYHTAFSLICLLNPHQDLVPQVAFTCLHAGVFFEASLLGPVPLKKPFTYSQPLNIDRLWCISLSGRATLLTQESNTVHWEWKHWNWECVLMILAMSEGTCVTHVSVTQAHTGSEWIKHSTVQLWCTDTKAVFAAGCNHQSLSTDLLLMLWLWRFPQTSLYGTKEETRVLKLLLSHGFINTLS